MLQAERWWSTRMKFDSATRRLVWGLGIWLFVAIFGDFLANDRPLYMYAQGKHYAPIFRQYATAWGWLPHDTLFTNAAWRTLPDALVLLPPIPYAATSLDAANADYVSPFAQQHISHWRYRHWLGTDQLGRDVAAGIIAGTRFTLCIALIATGVATALALLIGGIAGFWGNTTLRWSLPEWVLYPLLFSYAMYVGVMSYQWLGGGWQWLLIVVAVWLLVYGLYSGIYAVCRKMTSLRTWAVPLDMVLMRVTETINGIPDVLLLLILLAILQSTGAWVVGCLIGLLSWSSRALLLRAELLRIRALPYIQTTLSMGFSRRYVFWRHALPNALAPLWVATTYGISSAVLAEATLSFLGIGSSAEQVTWGKLLEAARDFMGAWWLAVFPGLAIFSVVYLFNGVARALQQDSATA